MPKPDPIVLLTQKKSWTFLQVAIAIYTMAVIL